MSQGTPQEILTDARISLRDFRDGEHRTTCPQCSHLRRNKTDPCLAVRIDQDGATWFCHHCGWKAGTRRPADIRVHRPAPRNLDTAGFALEIWRHTRPIRGTIAETYLRRRGIGGDLPDVLRFHPTCPRGKGERLPAMVALLVDIKTNKACGIHRTFLKPDGSGKDEAGKSKMMLGRSKGAVVKLTPDDEVTMGLAIAEGIETALTMRGANFPVWACGSATGIETFPALPGIEGLAIFADHDPAGIEAALICSRRQSAAGIETRIIYPKQRGADFNDLLRSAANG